MDNKKVDDKNILSNLRKKTRKTNQKEKKKNVNGEQALNTLLHEGFLHINQAGWARITKLPKNNKELNLLVKTVKTLGAWSVNPNTIEISTGSDNDEILFRKKTT
jgi:hypothetical protein